MLPAALQILAFGLALLGLLGAAAATLLPNWAVSVAGGGPRGGGASRTQGLWSDCVWFGSGVFTCAAAAHLWAARGAMLAALCGGALGLSLAALGLKCARWGGGRRAKARTAVAAGLCLILSGLLCLGPAASWVGPAGSWVGPGSRVGWGPGSGRLRPGGALTVSLVSAGLLLTGGVIFCLSCPGPAPPSLDLHQDLEPPAKPTQSRRVRVSLAELRDSYSLQEYV